MTSGIYVIENTVNGKKYIGSAVDINKRKKLHLYHLRGDKHHSRKLQNSYNKHGEEAFAFRPLLICRKEDLLFYEQLVLDKFDAVRTGYNVAPVAGTREGMRNTAEANARIREAAKAQWTNPEHRANMSIKTREQMSNPEMREKIGAANRGRKHSPETVEKNRKAQTGKVQSHEHRARISAGLLRHYRKEAA